MKATQVIVQVDVLAESQKTSQVVTQGEVKPSTILASQVIAQTDVAGQEVEVSQLIVQVETVLDPHSKRVEISEGIAVSDYMLRDQFEPTDDTLVSDSINVEVHPVPFDERLGIGEVIEGFGYYPYANAIDSPYVAPVRIMKIEFTGLTLYFCDRTWDLPQSTGRQGTYCVYDNQLYEPLILSIGKIEHGKIDPVTLNAAPSRCDFVIDNNTPVGGAGTFSRLFNTYDPQYALVTISEFFEGVNYPTDKKDIFKGYIEDAVGMSTDKVVITCTGHELAIVNKFTYDELNTDTYPNAAEKDVGKMLPQVYGSAKRVPFLGADPGGIATLVSALTIDQFSGEVSDVGLFPSSGTIQIEDEQIEYSGKDGNNLMEWVRGANQTVAAAHSSGTTVVEIQDAYVYIIGHAVSAVNDVYVYDRDLGQNVKQGDNYTAYLGGPGEAYPGYTDRCAIVFNSFPTPIGGEVSADVDGFKDDVFGTCTGVPDKLIKSPEAIIKHILLNRCGLTADAINLIGYETIRKTYAVPPWSAE